MITPVLYRESTSLGWPESFPLKSHQALKVAAVALACLSLFSIQLGFSLGVGISISLGCATVTLLSEKLRGNTSDWFGVKDIDTRALSTEIALRFIVVPIWVGLAYSLIGLPAQVVMQQLLSGNIRTIFLATVIAPIAEEILFRGFVQERAEDIANLVDRYIYPVSFENQKIIGCAVQGLLFGAVHIIGAQVQASRMVKAIFFLNLSWVGLYLGYIKSRDNSLLSPMALHSTQNSTITLGLLAFRRLILRSA